MKTLTRNSSSMLSFKKKNHSIENSMDAWKTWRKGEIVEYLKLENSKERKTWSDGDLELDSVFGRLFLSMGCDGRGVWEVKEKRGTKERCENGEEWSRFRFRNGFEYKRCGFVSERRGSDLPPM